MVARHILCFGWIFFLGAWTAALRAESPAEVDFDIHIKPILSDRCYKCHGPDAGQRQADLRLDQMELALERVITVGDADSSELYRRITSTDPDERMPPPAAKLSLSSSEIELVRKWIAQGALWKDHWSFRPPGEVAIPQVKNDRWSLNPIDRFVLARLQTEGLQPAPEAKPEQLLRRVTLDLTGLPPSLDQIDTLLADPSDQAYERAVDRLLDSTRFGERMASIWLDIARYSDTFGYQVDSDRFVWPWRDWVIGALNQNLPYDHFVTWQLAGDLLPGATDQQILATTFNRLHPQKSEGGSVEEEFRVEYVADRTQTFATALLGLTLECARCHDHKFDPVTQREYYQLFAFFDNIDEAGLYAQSTGAVPTPTLQLIDQNAKQDASDVERFIVDAEQKLRQIGEERHEAFEEWLALSPHDRAVSLVPTEKPNVESDDDSNEKPVEQTENEDVSPNGQLPDIPGGIAYLHFEDMDDQSANQPVPGRYGTAVRLSGDDAIQLDVGRFRRFEPFSIALWINTPDEKHRAVVFHCSDSWTDSGSRGYQLLIEQGRLSASLIHFWPGNAIRIRTHEKIPTGEWLHVAVTYDGSSRADGLSIFVNGHPATTTVVRDNLFKNIADDEGKNVAIGARKRDSGFSRGLVDEFRVFHRQLTDLEVAHLHDGSSLTLTIQDAATGRADRLRDDLYRYYLAASDSQYTAQLAVLRKLRKQRSELYDKFLEIMIMRELAQPRPTYVLKRGAYDARTDRVEPGTPNALPPFPDTLPRNRLGLARWLTDPANPLVARVAVNRFWQMCFGKALVRTPEDLGSQGAVPTHPELLDWLAVDFVDHDWDIKRLLRSVVTSATYRQGSAASPDMLARDPDNRLLGRQSVYRLPAEMLRDSALAVSGLLVEQIGGPPARPYELEASFKPVDRDKASGLYRRSVYTYWKRTGPAPVMMALDASKRDVCRVRRERTASPLQALVLLNGPQFVEAARQLSGRLIRQHADNIEGILDDMFRILTSRRPSTMERRILKDLYDRQLARFKEDPDRADALIGIGDSPADANVPTAELAAATMVANSLMSFDEAVMKR